MPQDSLSSTTQSIGNAGLLTMVCLDSTGGGNNIELQFNPTYARITNFQYAPFQHVNMSAEGRIHTFQYSENEALTWNIFFQDLPSFSLRNDPREQSDGVIALLDFIRYTLGYHASTTIVTSPDGYIETMRYMDGVASFIEYEGSNRAQRAQRWAGTLTMARVLD